MTTTILLSSLLAITLMAAALLPRPTSAQDNPPQPPILSANPATEGDAVLLTWQPTPDVVSYQIWYGPAGLNPGDGHLWPIDDPAATSALIRPLQPHATYAFHIMAKVQPAEDQQSKWSLWSQAASALPARAQAPPERTQPVPDSICHLSYHLVARVKLALDTDASCSTIGVDQLAAVTRLDLSQAPTSGTDLATRTESILWNEHHDQYQGGISIPASHFAGLTNVTHLNVNGLNWNSLDPEIFRHMPNLQHLDASRNGIQRLSANHFSHAPTLTHIHLEHNLIEHVNQQAFDQLPQLRLLDLSHNSIYAMPSQAVTVSKHPSLAVLSLAFNPGSDGPLSELPVTRENNSRANPLLVCLALDDHHSCVAPSQPNGAPQDQTPAPSSDR